MKNIRATPAPSHVANVQDIGAAVLAASQRKQPKTISLVATSPGSMVTTVAVRMQELGVFAVPCLGASVA